MHTSTRHLLFSLFTVHFSLLTAMGQEVAVDSLRYAGPYAVGAPLMIDSLDVNGHAYDAKSLLDALSAPRLDATTATLSADALPERSEATELHLAGFTLTTSGYATVDIHVDGGADYRLYVDGSEAKTGTQSLEPATHEVCLTYLTRPDSTARPTISLSTAKPELIHIGTGAGQRMYTLSDVIRGTRFGGIELSPDGRYLITTTRTNLDGGRSQALTQVSELSTGRIVARTTDRLRWLPTTNRYYLRRETPDGTQLVTIDPATGAETVFIDRLPGDEPFTIVPTEDRLIIHTTHQGPVERDDVYEVIHPDDRQPGWRNRSGLALYDIRTGLTRPLTFGHHDVYLHDLSTDGRLALISVSRSRLTQRPTTLSTLYLLDLQTLDTTALVRDDGFIAQCALSPDATQVLISGSPECLGGIGMNVDEGQTPSMIDTQLYLLTLSTGDIEPLTRTFNPCIQQFRWSQADGHIYFTAEDRDCIHLFRIDGRTHAISLLDAREDIIKSFSLARTAPTMAYYGESATNSERLYTTRTTKWVPTTVRDLHAEQFADVALAECYPYDHINSRGDTICCRYYLPPGFDAGRRYPMIVNYYGGCSPTSRNFEGRYPHHAYAALGYVVLIINPSGATGFGQSFSARHVATAGQRVADDIIDATRAFMAEHPYVDPARIGCIGASYGGFMTQWLQTQTDLFAAAVSHAGISDHTSYWGEGYWGYSYSEVSMANAYPWTHTDLYVDQSPLYHADKIHTPLLFVHGDADHNVPVGESIQLYTALKLLGRETAMVLVSDQDHHILDYTKRIRWQATIFAWFDKWLKGDDTWWESMYPHKEL